MTLREAKKSLKAELKEVPGIFGFGIGDGHLWVYVIPSFDTTSLPDEHEGYAVVPISGEPVAQPSDT